MADENNSQILQEINELLDKLKTFPENRENATDEQKAEIKEIYKQLFQKESYKHTAELDDERKACTVRAHMFKKKKKHLSAFSRFSDCRNSPKQKKN